MTVKEHVEAAEAATRFRGGLAEETILRGILHMLLAIHKSLEDDGQEEEE